MLKIISFILWSRILFFDDPQWSGIYAQHRDRQHQIFIMLDKKLIFFITIL